MNFELRPSRSVDLMPFEKPVLLLGTLNSELTVLSCLRIKTLRLAREVVGLALDSSSVEH